MKSSGAALTAPFAWAGGRMGRRLLEAWGKLSAAASLSASWETDRMAGKPKELAISHGLNLDCHKYSMSSEQTEGSNPFIVTNERDHSSKIDVLHVSNKRVRCLLPKKTLPVWK